MLVDDLDRLLMDDLAGIALVFTIPTCPSQGFTLYIYPAMCVVLGMTWIGRGKRLSALMDGNGALLPQHAPVVMAQGVPQPVVAQAVPMAAPPRK